MYEACILPEFIEGLRGLPYTMRGRRRRMEAAFRLVMIKSKDRGGKDKLLIFAASLKPEKIRKLFRERLGVETFYGMIGEFHAKTVQAEDTIST